MSEQYILNLNSEDNPSLQVVGLRELQKRYFQNGTDESLNMTSLGTFILLEKSLSSVTSSSVKNDDNAYDTDNNLHRLSLAHEGLDSMPKILIQEVAPTVKILDLSYNEFDSLNFLTEFINLNSLICDHNNIRANSCIPFMPNLELLWMNYCQTYDIFHLICKISCSCPNLKYLSLMGNPGIQTFLFNRVSNSERTRYRLFTISLFPCLRHLDDQIVSKEERQKSHKLYHKNVIDVQAARAMPNSLQRVTCSSRLSTILSRLRGLKNETKNLIV
ncbi:leucine-rich melanocyte differentiation-associated protein-like isoform X1 [Diorhabda carinulata]|uniref:leucine-rich melanocyte differentiation-associated protein-like isoform X1 n=2 Tax=Diorhabda carinulata TaxID=1163345 RepID=UPI0025A2F79F|nr:leucine-rich melanocyte differentiation-associated protein-like isoform X1 [Diorhabda carinulata]